MQRFSHKGAVQEISQISGDFMDNHFGAAPDSKLVGTDGYMIPSSQQIVNFLQYGKYCFSYW